MVSYLIIIIVSYQIQNKEWGNEFSSFTEQLSGVPQVRSVLGPLRFLIYIDTIVQMFCKIDTVIDIELLQKDINRVCDWPFGWSLSFNTNKCKILQLGNNPVRPIL